MSKFLSKRTNLQHAMDRLRESIDEFHQNPHIHSVQDGVIQRFEFTYELSWKTLKAYFEENGIATL
jgi:nucleotidyltransferase substrate binding protein (TIGR01987 family)